MLTKQRISAFAFIAGLAILGIGGALLRGADDREAGIEIAKQQKALAEEALKNMTTVASQGQENPDLRDLPRWSRRLLEATRKSGASKAEIVEAAKKHVDRIDRRVVVLKRIFTESIGSRADVLDAEYEALAAKGLLQEVKGAQ